MTKPVTPAYERFLKLISYGGLSKYAPTLGPCWLFGKGNRKDGYRQFSPDSTNAKSVYVHRWSYEYHKGPIPPLMRQALRACKALTNAVMSLKDKDGNESGERR
jgi:hypothetical protein